MLDYQAYILGQDGHIKKRIDIRAADDNAALENARRYVDGHDVELWQQKRIVATLPHGEPGKVIWRK